MSNAETKWAKRVALQVTDVAPDFNLPALIGGVKKSFRLSEQLEVSHVVLAFYPFNWEPVSAAQLSRYRAERENLQSAGIETVGICVESIMNTTSWEREIGPFDFPLCSDFWPHGAVSEHYGVLRQTGNSAGASKRAVFAVHRNGTIVYRRIYADDQEPELEESIESLRSL